MKKYLEPEAEILEVEDVILTSGEEEDGPETEPGDNEAPNPFG